MEVDQINVSCHHSLTLLGEQAQGTDQDGKHLPFVEKYRPDDLSQIISHREIVSTSKYSFW